MPALSAGEEPNPFEKVTPGIARLNVGGFRALGHCTAVQVGRRAVLAVGGCLNVGRFDEAHFLFGYDRGRWLEHRVGQRAFSDPRHFDLTLLCLDKSLAPSPFRAAGEPVAAGDRVIVASYSAPAFHRLTFRGCEVTQVHPDSGIALGCPAGPGSAGGAAFILRGEGAQLLGVVAAGSQTASIVLGWIGENPDQLCPREQTEGGANG